MICIFPFYSLLPFLLAFVIILEIPQQTDCLQEPIPRFFLLQFTYLSVELNNLIFMLILLSAPKK